MYTLHGLGWFQAVHLRVEAALRRASGGGGGRPPQRAGLRWALRYQPGCAGAVCAACVPAEGDRCDDEAAADEFLDGLGLVALRQGGRARGRAAAA